MHHHSRSRIYYKLLLSYMLIFAIPLSGLGISMYFENVVILQREIESSGLKQLSQIREVMDLYTNSLEQTSNKMAYDHRLTPFVLKNQPYERIEAITELDRYKNNNIFATEILLYYHGDDVIYSSKGVSSLLTLTRNIYRFDTWDEKQFVEDINSTMIPKVRPAESIQLNNYETRRMLTFMHPITSGNRNPHGIVLFLVDESILADMTGNILDDFQGSVYILNEKREVVASNHSGRVVPLTEIVNALPDEDEPKISSFEAADETYSLIQMRSPANRWTYVLVLPTDQFFQRVVQKKVFILIIILILFFIGLVTAILLSGTTYRPIRKMTDQITQMKPLAREQILHKLIKGDSSEEEGIRSWFEDERVTLQGRRFYVLYVALGKMTTGSANATKRENMVYDLSVLQVEHAWSMTTELVHDHAIIVLIGSAKDTDPKSDQLAASQRVQNRLQQKFSVRPTIGVGGSYSDIFETHRSFIEAMASADYKIKGDGSIIFFDEIDDWRNPSAWYPLEDQVKFAQSLKQGNKIVALEALDSMMHALYSREQSILMLKLMCIDLINTLYKTISDLKIDGFSSRIQEIMEFDSLDRLNHLLVQAVEEVCFVILRRKENEQKLYAERITDYMRSEFHSPDISLEKMADHFDLSLSHLSRYIKEHTGQTFTDYMSELRINEIKRLLLTTDLPIKDVIAEAGYLDISNAMRKFKKQEGVTLGEYRKMHAQDDDKRI